MTLADPVSPDLRRHLRTLKLGQLLATLPAVSYTHLTLPTN